MSFLDDISSDDRQLLVSLPYRVGLFVSQSDQQGGDASDAEEAQVLASLLAGYAGEVFGSETVQYIISDTVKQKDAWPAWGAGLNSVEADCRRAVSVLGSVVDVKEVNAFKQHLMEVGESVALAFREANDVSGLARLKLRFEFMKLEYSAKKKGHSYKTFEEFLNISPAERLALEGLRDALDIEYAI